MFIIQSVTSIRLQHTSGYLIIFQRKQLSHNLKRQFSTLVHFKSFCLNQPESVSSHFAFDQLLLILLLICQVQEFTISPLF